LARRTFNVVDITEILVHWHAGRSISEIARSLGVDRNTVRKYTAAAQEAGIQPGEEPISATRWAELIRGWFPHLVSTELQHPRFAEIAPFHELIAQMLETNTVTTVHQRLRDERGLGVSITTFRRYVWATMPDHQAGSARITVRKDDPPPGQEAQIDYGYLGQWLDPATGRGRRVWAFVMVLSASRHLFVRPVLAMTLAAWIQAHVLALGFFGGAPRRLVTDNLKASVIRPDLYDPKLNRTYAELASHYGVLVDPARARKPKDKPRVERPIPYVRDSFFAGRDFASLQAMQQAAVTWSLEVAGRRACRPLGGAQPLVVFQATEQPALLGLPLEPYELAAWATRRSRPTATSVWTGRCTRCRGGWSATGSTCASPLAWSRCSVTGSWSRPTGVPSAAGATPTGATTHPRRSRS
jgi:transposase